ncbi:hypothetical protein HDU90_006737 [Geranomyces variabilis]|nr:hypothetical protein HDU90_006737 [Geranomyces variabilis]
MAKDNRPPSLPSSHKLTITQHGLRFEPQAHGIANSCPAEGCADQDALKATEDAVKCILAETVRPELAAKYGSACAQRFAAFDLLGLVRLTLPKEQIKALDMDEALQDKAESFLINGDAAKVGGRHVPGEIAFDQFLVQILPYYVVCKGPADFARATSSHRSPTKEGGGGHGGEEGCQ